MQKRYSSTCSSEENLLADDPEMARLYHVECVGSKYQLVHGDNLVFPNNSTSSPWHSVSTFCSWLLFEPDISGMLRKQVKQKSSTFDNT